MNFFNLNPRTIAQGGADFRTYARAMICGTYDEAAYDQAMQRRGGIVSLPGAIIALIEFGIRDPEGVTHGASRITRCSRDTVRAFLKAFTGSEPNRHLFFLSGGSLTVHRETRLYDFPETIFAA